MSEALIEDQEGAVEQPVPKKKLPYPGFWGSILLLLVWLVFTVVAAMVFAFLSDQMSVYLTISYVAGFAGAIALGYSLKKEREPYFKFQFSFNDPMLVVMSLLFILSFAVASDPLMSMLPEPADLLEALKGYKQTPLLAIFALTIAPAICEELVFRGIIADGLRKRLGWWPAILISSFLFGAIHGNWIQFVGATILGLFLAWIYFKTNSIAYPMLLHFFNNLIATVALLSGHEEIDFASLFDSMTTYYALSVGGLFLMGFFLWIINQRLKTSGTT